MNLVDRVKNILLQPKQEWPVIAAEVTDVKRIYMEYIIILAAVPAIVSILSSALLGSVMGRAGMAVGLGFGVGAAILGYVLALVMVYVVAMIADVLAPSFDGEKNFLQSLKLVAYSMTASWVASVFSIIPLLGWFLSFVAGLYGIFIFYTGTEAMKKVPEAKAIGYTIVVILAALIVGFIITAITGAVLLMGAAGTVAGLRGF